LRTIAEPAGTVTVTFLSASLFAESDVPYTARKLMSAEPVANVADFAASALFTATTYSVPVFASVREKAYTPAPSAAYRSLWTPSVRAGLSLRSLERALIDL
jgi:hypothetical protein